MKPLPPHIRAAVLADLHKREQYTLKAIARRHGVSRTMLIRLAAEPPAPRKCFFDMDSETLFGQRR